MFGSKGTLTISAVVTLFFTLACGQAFHETTLGGQTSLDTGSAASIEAFKATLHPVLTSNCAACHGSSQSPLFAVGDGSFAYNQLMARNLVNLSNPGSSAIVQKIQLGHNGFPQSLATQLTTQITNWANLLNQSQPAPAPSPSPSPTPATNTYSYVSKNILGPKCVACHGASLAQKNVRYDSYAATMKTVSAGSSSTSLLFAVCTSGSMPPQPSPRLTSTENAAIRAWIDAGALNN